MKPRFQSNGFILDRLSIIVFVMAVFLHGMINPKTALEDLYETIKDMGDFEGEPSK